MKRFVYILLTSLYSILGTQYSFSQNKNIDSLLTLLKTDKEDTNKVFHLNKLCNEYIDIGENDKGLTYSKKALMLAQNLGFKKGEAKAHNNIGIIYKNQGNYPEALKNCFASLKIKEEIKDKKGIASSLNNIGTIYFNQSNYTEALKNYFASLRIFEEIKDKYGIAVSYNNIGNIYKDQKNYSEALKNYFSSLKIMKEIKDNYGIAYSYMNIGIVYDMQGNNPEALKMYFASLKIKEEMGDKDGIAASFINLGQLYTKLNKTQEAEDYLSRALQLSLAIGSKEWIKESYAGFAVLDSITDNFKAAFTHHKLFVIYRDSIDNEETQKKNLQSIMQYEFDKKEIAAKAEQEKLDALSAEEKQKQLIVIYAAVGVLLIVFVFSLVLLMRFRITNRQKVIIEKQKEQVDKAYESLHEKNKEVMDSINYASRIQRALLPSEKYITNQLNRLINN